MFTLTGKRLHNPVKFPIDEIWVSNKIHYSDWGEWHLMICVLRDEKQWTINSCVWMSPCWECCVMCKNIYSKDFIIAVWRWQMSFATATNQPVPKLTMNTLVLYPNITGLNYQWQNHITSPLYQNILLRYSSVWLVKSKNMLCWRQSISCADDICTLT